MIVAQERDIPFTAAGHDGWSPSIKSEGIFKEMEESLALPSNIGGWQGAYLFLLGREGEAFRQRIVDYVPPENADG